jgi:hypothetical protein
MTATTFILVAQAIASGAMCGLIWFVQVVHYPMFVRIAGDASRAYAIEHQRRTTWVVAPLMLVELVTAAMIAMSPPPGIGRGLALFGLVVVLLLWASTALLQAPLHGKLAREGHSNEAVASLVRGNWGRTLLWTVRAVVATWMLHAASIAG